MVLSLENGLVITEYFVWIRMRSNCEGEQVQKSSNVEIGEENDKGHLRGQQCIRDGFVVQGSLQRRQK
jgi:hypothetical protein